MAAALSPTVNVTVDAAKLSSNGSSASIDVIGSFTHVITDEEIKKTFGLQDKALKDAIESRYGGRPDEIYLKSPTPWNDLYHTYKWSQVTTNIKPRSVRVTELKNQIVVLSTKEFVNDSDATTMYNSGITHEVKESLTNMWKQEHGITLTDDVQYVFDIDFGKAGGKTFLSCSGPWGDSCTVQNSETLGLKSGGTFTLNPGQSAVATLQASRVTMEVEVVYDVCIAGEIACNYTETFQGHHFWRYPISVATSGGISTKREVTQTIRVLFYSDANIVVTDKDTDTFLSATPALIRREKTVEVPSCAFVHNALKNPLPVHKHPKIVLPEISYPIVYPSCPLYQHLSAINPVIQGTCPLIHGSCQTGCSRCVVTMKEGSKIIMV